MSSFRIATYNIHKCRGLDRRIRPKRIAEVLKQVNADIIALQEVVGMDEALREHNQVSDIAEELGMDFRTGENRRLHGGAYGNAILTRMPILTHHNHDLTWRKNEPRGCLDVTVEDGNMPDQTVPWLQIFNVHLGTGFLERRFQASRLIHLVGDQFHASTPRIVLGDFNEWTRGLASQLFSRHFKTAELNGYFGRARSYPGVMPFLHLDHIYYDSPFELTNIQVHRSRLALIASDHLPLVADFILRG